MNDLPSTVVEAQSAPHSHFVQFYETDAFLCDSVVRFLVEGLREGEPAVVIATEAHREAFARQLRAKGIDVAQAEADHRLVMLDARRTLDGLMEGDRLHAGRFREVAEGMLASIAPEPRARPIRAYGEMVDLLWRDGQPDAALQLEDLWNELAARHSFSLLCSYGVDSFYQQHGIPAICATHGQVLPPEPSSPHASKNGCALNISSLVAEIARRIQTERVLREALRSQREAMDALRRAEADARESKQERDRMIEELTRTVRLNETFASALAHDLRNPLNTILMGGQTLMGRVDDPLGVRALQRTIRSVTRMQGMIDQLLDFSRARTGAGIPLECKLADVGVIARDVTEEVRAAQPEVSIELEARGELRGELDAARLAQVLSNLLGNAVQHGRGGAPIALHLDGTSPDAITMTIANRGTISDELLPILFAPFRGAHQRGARSQGLGLSLFIADQLVRAHGGTLAARSVDDRTELTIVLPRRAAGSAAVTFDLQPATIAEPHARRHVGSATDESLRMLIRSIRDYAIFMLDPAGYVISWNTGAQLIKGYTADEITGRHFSIFYPREDIRAGKCEHELAIAERTGQYEEQGWRLRKDGTPFWANVLITAVRDHSGALAGFAKVTRDLTEARLASEAQRQNEERFRLLVEGVKEYAIFMLDPEGHVKTWNPGAARIKGYRACEIIGKHFSVFYPQEDIRAGKTEIELEVAARDGRFEDEGWRLRKDGSRFWANVVITALHDERGKLLGFAKVTCDLTERRKHEEDRIRLVHAQEAVRLRDEFLTIASHELRTPLTVLRMQLETLRKRLGKGDPAVVTQLDRTHRAGQRLTELVEMLLDVSCIATGKFELRTEVIDLATVVREVVDRMSESSSAARCTVTCSLGEGVCGAWDRSRIDQVVTNLLANAFKYAAGTAIEVSLRGEPGAALIEVRDHGPGIPQGRETILFGRFERAASMQHYGGLGLGLYVVDQIAQAHGGEASAANAPGGGACFRVKLPLHPQSAAMSA